MKRAGYTLVEVLVAVVVVAVGITAAAVLVGAIMGQEELNQVSLRAANLQEQAVALYRLGQDQASIRSFLPETCGTSATPAQGQFSVFFGGAGGTTNISSSGETITLQTDTCTVIYPNPISGSGEATYSTNAVTVLRPTIQ